MSKLGEKIKGIRLKEGLSQDEFAKELGYSSRSTINKIEKGINEISYEKLMLLIKKYEVSMDELFDRDHKDIFEPSTNESVIYISFSARNNGNSIDIANYLMDNNDRLISFKDIFYNPCSKCNYECFSSVCKYRYDDIYELLNCMTKYKKIVFIVPMYSGNSSSLYFILSERMQDYFNHNEEKWDEFISKLHIVAIYGSDEETPYFIEIFKSVVNEAKILKIERHKYNLKRKDKIIENDKIIVLLKNFKNQ
ncbi:MAG: helix-turn-helix domain-containing protein [Prevotella sp.]|nr:helix-turn-helix domain-containing protein [Prevotella sp.]